MIDDDDIEYEESSGNVFEDIGFDPPAASRLPHKAELVGALHRAYKLDDAIVARIV